MEYFRTQNVPVELYPEENVEQTFILEDYLIYIIVCLS